MKHCKQAFTLIELLVVICIIAILASMLLPALQSARESANTATCISNLGQFSKAYQMYATNFNDFMPAHGSWENALIEALGQDTNKSPFKKSFFCDADSSVDDTSTDAYGMPKKKSYSLNNLKEVIHPRIPLTLGAGGKEVTGTGEGCISGNKTTSVYTASSLIIIGENVSSSNSFGNGSMTPSTSDVNSPGSASAVQQQVALVKRLTSHNTAGELYLDGHARHVKPQQTYPAAEGRQIAIKTTYSNSGPTGCATEGFGDWSDCPKRKEGNRNCPGDSTCHKK